MRLKRVVYALVMTTLPLPLHAMMFHSHLLTPEKKHILLIGDWHDVEDSNFIDTFFSRIGYMGRATLTQPIPLLLELEQSSQQKDLSKMPKTFGWLYKLHEAQKNLEHRQFDFEFCDPRDRVSREIHSVMTFLSKQLVTELSTYLEAHYGIDSVVSQDSLESNERSWKSNFPAIKRALIGRPVTLGEYLLYLDTMEDYIKELAKKRDSEKLKSVIIKKLEEFRAAKKYCCEVFKKHQKSDSFSYALSCLFDGCKNVKDRLNLCDKLSSVLCDSTDYVYAELYFLNSLYERLIDNPVVCLYAGFIHVKKITELLTEELGCTLLDINDATYYWYPLYFAYNPSAYNSVLPLTVIDDFLRPITDTSVSCLVCKSKKSKLLACAKCKKAFYCDRSCQIKHWPFHKVVCDASAQLVKVKAQNE